MNQLYSAGSGKTKSAAGLVSMAEHFAAKWNKDNESQRIRNSKC